MAEKTAVYVKTIVVSIVLAGVVVVSSGCALLSTALSLGAAYGIYQITKD